MSTLDHVWPSGLAQSLWNYEALQQPRNIPFMGYEPSSDFYLALAAGVAVIVVFALRRFNVHSSEPETFEFRALRELNPMDLRAGTLMSQAYLRYVGVLLVVYLALTLFGSLILRVLNSLPSVAGLQVDTASFDFDSPQWPLLISFGIAGFVPMLKPVDLLERRLRAWAHRSAGIPIRITQQTNRVKKALDRLTGPEPNYAAAPNWLDKIAPIPEQKRAFKTRAQLLHLLDWSKDQRPYWPSAKARGVLRNIEREEMQAAFVTLEAFDDLLIESYDRSTLVESAERQATGMAEAATDFSGRAASDRSGRTLSYMTGSKNALLRHRRRLEREWNDLTARMELARDEFASMLAIFIEHDDRTEEIQNPALKQVVAETRGEGIVEDTPTFWLYLALIPVGLAYFVAIPEYHSLLSNVEADTLSVTLSVLLNTAKTAIQFCIPLSFVMGWRYILSENHDNWVRIDADRMNRTMVRELLRAAGIALAVAVVLFALLGLLWAAFISRNEQQFEQKYISGDFPYLLIFMTQSMIAVATTVITLMAVEYVRVHGLTSRWKLVPFGLLNAFAVLTCWIAHTGFWYGFGYCTFYGIRDNFAAVVGNVMLQGPGQPCFAIYEGTDLYVYVALAFGSACLFIPLERSGKTARTSWQTRLRVLWRTGRLRSIRTAGTVLLGAALLAAGAAQAQDAPAWPNSAKRPDHPENVVRLGFRADAKPFSYFDATENRYRGYLVDLCHRIFDAGAKGDDPPGAKYDVIPVEVNAVNRFNAFMANPRQPHVDVLCDPVTIRFPQNDNDGRDGGVFSPIVFASGVSYLRRSPQNRASGSVVLGYVEKSTAVLTAERACAADLFNAQDDISAHGCAAKPLDDCFAAPQDSFRTRENGEVDPTPWTARKYFYCSFESHTEAIAWFCADSVGPDENADFFSVERAYFGDRDIIVGMLEAAQRQFGCREGVETKAETYTYEPYALVINKADVELVRFVQRRVYQIFSNRNEIAALFSGNFNGKQMTRPLANLFLMNAVELED